MKKSEFEKWLGQHVEVKVKGVIANITVQGVLHKSGEECFKNNLNLYLPSNYYFCLNENGNVDKFLFRSSDVVSVKER